MTFWFRLGLAAAAIAAVNGWLWLHDRKVIAQDRLEAAVEAQRADARADDAAGQVAASQAATVERGNDDAREAANVGSDPLGDGLRKLRTGKAGGAVAPARPANVQR